MSITHKLRGKLSPIYSLADMVSECDNNPELIKLCIEQAKQVLAYKDEIDELLSQINDLDD